MTIKNLVVKIKNLVLNPGSQPVKSNPALSEFLWHLILVCVIYYYGQHSFIVV